MQDENIKRREETKEKKEERKKICHELIQKFRKREGVKGVNLMGKNKEQMIEEIINESKTS